MSNKENTLTRFSGSLVGSENSNQGCMSSDICLDSCNNNIDIDSICQDYTIKKYRNLFLADSFLRLGFHNVAHNVRQCGTYLSFVVDSQNGVFQGVPKLYRANFCKNRLCPTCCWRRSKKMFSRLSDVVNDLSNTYDFLFLTLTIPNCARNNLEMTLDYLNSAKSRFFKFKDIKQFCRGAFINLEITYNRDKETFHPHYHCLIAVDKSYFTNSALYISRDRLLDLWRRACDNHNITQVDIRRVSNDKKSLCELSKYSVKDSDFLFDDDIVLTDELVFILHKALYHKRFVSYNGVFSESFKRLFGVDYSPETDSLDDDVPISELQKMVFVFGWHGSGFILYNLHPLSSELN